jgi:hypothetical protein
MKSIVIIGAWCNTIEKEKALIECILASKKEELDVLVFSRLPLRGAIQELCDYVIYDKTNPIIYDRSLLIWHCVGDRKITTATKYDWGFAAMEQIVKSLGFANFLDYENAYWINYDIDTTNFSTFIKQSDEALIDNDMFCFKWSGISIYDPNDKTNAFDLTAASFKINSCYLAFKNSITFDNYKRYLNNTSLIGEDIFFYLVKESGIRYKEHNQLTYLPAKISNEGDRVLGNIPNRFEKTFEYTERAFLGKHGDRFKVFIMFIKKPIFSISVYDGISIKRLEEINSNSPYIEIEIDKPTQLEIISINGKEIGEILDEYVDSNYFNTNTIESI